MELIRSRLRDHIDDSAVVVTILGVEVICEDAKFGNRIQIGNDTCSTIHVLLNVAPVDQESIGQFEKDFPGPGVAQQPEITFVRDTDFDNDRREYRAGFSTSPWSWPTTRSSWR